MIMSFNIGLLPDAFIFPDVIPQGHTHVKNRVLELIPHYFFSSKLRSIPGTLSFLSEALSLLQQWLVKYVSWNLRILRYSGILYIIYILILLFKNNLHQYRPYSKL